MRTLIAVATLALMPTLGFSETKILFTEKVSDYELYMVKCKNNIFYAQHFIGDQEQWSKKFTYDCLSGVYVSSAENQIFFTSQGKVLHSLSKKNGDMEWALPLPPGASSISQVFTSHDRSKVIVAAYKTIYIVDAEQGIPIDIVEYKDSVKNVFASKNGYSFFSGVYPYKWVGLDLDFNFLYDYTTSLSYSTKVQVSNQLNIATLYNGSGWSGKVLNLTDGTHLCDFSQSGTSVSTYGLLSDGSITYTSANSLLRIKDASCATLSYNVTHSQVYSSYAYPVQLMEDGQLIALREYKISGEKNLDLLYFDDTARLLNTIPLQTPPDMLSFDPVILMDASGEHITIAYVDEKIDDAFVFEQKIK